MATAQSPFKNAAAAIYAVCVSKEYPHLPDDISEDGTSFLARSVCGNDNLHYYGVVNINIHVSVNVNVNVDDMLCCVMLREGV